MLRQNFGMTRRQCRGMESCERVWFEMLQLAVRCCAGDDDDDWRDALKTAEYSVNSRRAFRSSIEQKTQCSQQMHGRQWVSEREQISFPCEVGNAMQCQVDAGPSAWPSTDRRVCPVYFLWYCTGGPGSRVSTDHWRRATRTRWRRSGSVAVGQSLSTHGRTPARPPECWRTIAIAGLICGRRLQSSAGCSAGRTCFYEQNIKIATARRPSYQCVYM